ncbi:MAG: 1-deoxy-D-xylulose-5-phosphate synthase [Chloroflexota bacterium]|nr:MAG: 1-deoxy-D-xylulose-5-phosphate synthase [Chloroflexota bacterium]
MSNNARPADRTILSQIDGPDDLKRLSPRQLESLAAEIRTELVSTVTQTGGHLASNLGAVELTIALHTVFDSPRDRIVWDVGHQSYVHKLLTGRRESFGTIRQYGGLCGFPVREESPHDAFGAGHASTSISAALGIATARDLQSDDFHVVAVIGDGAMTGGMAFEALNHAGNAATRLIVILNDNQMSIAPNVGALSKALNHLRLDRRYHRMKEDAEHYLSSKPMGNQMLDVAKRLKNSVKGLVIPKMMWEELGFTYMGPVDGHSIPVLLAAMLQAKEYPSKPTLIHVITKKGKGHAPAEADAIRFHGVAPTGAAKGAGPSYTQVFGDTALKIARMDPDVVAITASMADNTGLVTMAREFPKRVFDVGICEEHAVTFAAGLAAQGRKPLVAIYSTFLQRAYDQIIHDVCIQELPVVFALDRAGIVGDDGKTHQGTFDLSFLRTVPNMVVMAPKDENELQHLVYTAIKSGRPSAVRYPRGSGTGVVLDSDLREIPVGKAEVLREGSDVAILAIGFMVAPALEAAGLLQEAGVSACVVNARFVKPLDEELILALAQKPGKLFTVEENTLTGGFGSAVLELLERNRVAGVHVRRLGLPDEFIEHGTQQVLRQKCGLDAVGIATAVLEAFPDSAAKLASAISPRG